MTNETIQRFHLAIPVDDLSAADSFYCETLGCSKGRSDDLWIDFNFFGNQVTAHLVQDRDSRAATNPVDGDHVPSRHFGVILDMADWEALAARLEAAGTEFLTPPRIKFEGEIGEQATMFLFDPAGNALEFKSFADPTQLFAT